MMAPDEKQKDNTYRAAVLPPRPVPRPATAPPRAPGGALRPRLLAPVLGPPRPPPLSEATVFRRQKHRDE